MGTKETEVSPEGVFELCSAVAEFLGERIFVEGTEFALFGVDSPTPPDDTQTRHYRDREIDAEYPRDFSTRENAE